MGNLKRYRWAILFSIILLFAIIFKRDIGLQAANITKENIIQMIGFLPPIFIILGLLDVWVPKETMIKYMGKDSGLRGGVLAFIIGAAAAGPLYAAFPVAQMLLKKEASLINIFIFIGAWSTTKIPMFLFETSALGIGFSLSRLFLNIPVIIIIAYLTFKLCPQKDREILYKNAKTF